MSILNTCISWLFFKFGSFRGKHDFKCIFLVPIASEHRNFLDYQGKLHQLSYLPFGWSPALRVFSKLMKPPMLVLMRMGRESTD